MSRFPAFFRKSGNGRGFFPDSSPDELASLFTNDDERDASCPCSVADGEIDPTDPASSCQPAGQVIQEVTIDDFTP